MKMRKGAMIAIIAIVLVLVGSASAYVYVTSQEKANPEDINIKLNESGKLVEIGSIEEYNKIIKPGEKATQSPVTASQLTEHLQKIFKDVFGDNSKISIESTGPFRIANGSLAHVSIVTVETSEGINTYIYLIDANYLPENTGKGISLSHTFGEYVWFMEKADNGAKISPDQILESAKKQYASHFNASDNDKYDITLFKTKRDNYVYYVNVNDNKEIMYYDGNTGELLFDSYTPDTILNTTHTLEECQQKAQDTLDSKNYNYSENLSIEYNDNKEENNESLNYTFDIVYEHDGQKEVIGSIKIDAYTLEVLSYNINEPTIETEEETPENTTTDNNYEDTSYSSSSYSSSSSSSYYEDYDPTEDYDSYGDYEYYYDEYEY